MVHVGRECSDQWLSDGWRHVIWSRNWMLCSADGAHPQPQTGTGMELTEVKRQLQSVPRSVVETIAYDGFLMVRK